MKSYSNQQYVVFLTSLVLFLILFTFVFVWIKGQNEDQIRFLIANSAKISALLFVFTISISGINRILSSGHLLRILKIRPFIGLAFGTFHIAHLFFLIWLQIAIHPVFTLANESSLFAGAGAYFFIFLMMLTTFPKIKVKIRIKFWKLIHTIGIYWILGVFISTYMKKVLNHNENWIIFSLLIAVLMLRIYFLIKDKFHVGESQF